MNTDDPQSQVPSHVSSHFYHICPHHHVVVLNLRCRRSCHNANENLRNDGRRNRISGCRAAQGPERHGQAALFDGHDGEYHDFRFSFITHMSLVSSVSHALLDRCEFERNPIFVAAVRALGEAHLCTGLDNEKQCPKSCPIR